MSSVLSLGINSLNTNNGQRTTDYGQIIKELLERGSGLTPNQELGPARVSVREMDAQRLRATSLCARLLRSVRRWQALSGSCRVRLIGRRKQQSPPSAA